MIAKKTKLIIALVVVAGSNYTSDNISQAVKIPDIKALAGMVIDKSESKAAFNKISKGLERSERKRLKTYFDSVIPVQDRKSACDYILKLMNDTVCIDNRMKIISAISRIDPSRRDEFISQVLSLPLVLRILNSDGYIAIDTFSRFTSECRANYIKTFRRMLTRDISYSDRASLIKGMLETDIFIANIRYLESIRRPDYGREHFSLMKEGFSEPFNPIMPQPIATSTCMDWLNSMILGGMHRSLEYRLFCNLRSMAMAMGYYMSLKDNVRILNDIRTRIDRALRDRVPGDDFRRMLEVVETPLDRPVPPRAGDLAAYAARGDHAIGIHAEGRDSKTVQAVEALLVHQVGLSPREIKEGYRAFRDFLALWANKEERDIATLVLENRSGGGGFGGLLNGSNLMGIVGLDGQSLIGRLWIFAERYLEREREAVKVAILKSLVRSFEDGQIKCDDGKIQRLVVGVLQGRLAGVNVDGIVGSVVAAPAPLSDADISEMFFIPARQGMDAAALRAEIPRFLVANPRINEARLRNIVEGYIKMMGT